MRRRLGHLWLQIPIPVGEDREISGDEASGAH